jgi:hypothetical protein
MWASCEARPLPPFSVLNLTRHNPPPSSRMMLSMHLLQMPQRHMRINLRSRYIGMTQQRLHTSQIRPMLHHVCRAAMPQHMRTSLTPRPRSRPHHLPHPLPRQRLPPYTQKQRPLQRMMCLLQPTLHQPRPPQRQIPLHSLHRRPSQRHNPLLVALPSHLCPSLIEMHIFHPQRADLPHSKPPGIEQLQDRMISQRQPIRIRAPGHHTSTLQHLHHLALSQRLRQHLPTRRRLHIHRRIMRDSLIHQQPAIKPSQTAQLSRNRPRLHPVSSQPLHKPTHIRLRRSNQQPIAPLNMLGKLLHVPLVRLTTRRSQPLLNPQIRYKLPHRPRVPVNLPSLLHRSRLSRSTNLRAAPTHAPNPPSHAPSPPLARQKRSSRKPKK